MNRKKRRTDSSGFALVLTLALLAMLVLLVLVVSGLSKNDSRLASTALYQVQAKQNALLGLQVGLGELQRLAGPNSTITAQSSIKTTTAPIQRLTGVWLNQSLGVDPMTWLISGNQAPDSQLTIIQTSVILSTDTGFVALVDNAVTAASDIIRAKKIQIPSTSSIIGSYAFWVGDEGCKASVNVPASQAIIAPIGAPVRTNAEGSLSNFSNNNPQNAFVQTYDQIRNVAKDSNLKANFHSLTATNYGFAAGSTVLKAGVLNINARSERAWEAWLRAYNDLPVPGSEKIAVSLLADLADDIARRISTRVVAGKKVSRGPFIDPLSFRTSGILDDALAENGIVNVTATKILNQMEGVLQARSDTFRIRAYGEAINPASALGKPIIESTAYCEAIVQRTPDPAPGGFGRKFVIVYFRWLGADDI